MNEDFAKFFMYLIIFAFVTLFYSSLKGYTTNTKSVYLENKNITQAVQYRQNQDFYRGVPVEVR